MLRGSPRTWLFALACGLMVVGLARSDEPRSTWFSRLFLPDLKTATNPKKSDAAAKAAMPPPVDEKSAREDWMRRVEVCDKLREIAAFNHDDDLRRRADQLEARAWDAYVHKTGARSVVGDDPVIDEAGEADTVKTPPRAAAPGTKEERR